MEPYIKRAIFINPKRHSIDYPLSYGMTGEVTTADTVNVGQEKFYSFFPHGSNYFVYVNVNELQFIQ